jgi:Domain of unknown function (DUF4157)
MRSMERVNPALVSSKTLTAAPASMLLRTVARRTRTSEPSRAGESAVPAIVNDVLRSGGRPLAGSVRADMEACFGFDFSRIRIFSDTEAAESARAVNALAYTVGRNVVFAQGRYAPEATEGRKLLAHELVHTLQQSQADTVTAERISQPDDAHEQAAARVASQALGGPGAEQPSDRTIANMRHSDPTGVPLLDRQMDGMFEGHGADMAPAATDEEGIEVGDQLMILPRVSFNALPTASSGAQSNGLLSRQPVASDVCNTPMTMRKVISGKFEGGKTLDDYYPDLAGTGNWGANDTAGPFDTGTRAGSSVQLIGEYAAPCASPGPFTLGQTATIVRMRGDGKKLLENGKPLEGRTLDDIARSGRDASKAPFRQEFGFAISMADPISGAPYSMFRTYQMEVKQKTSLTGPGGAKSVDWGVTVESSAGKVTKNEVR